MNGAQPTWCWIFCCEILLMAAHLSESSAFTRNSDLGAHIDGFIATEATTIVVQSDPAAAVSGREADVISGVFG